MIVHYPSCSDLLFGGIYDTFSSEDNLSKAVFLEQLSRYIKDDKIRSLRTVVSKDLIGQLLSYMLRTYVG